VATTVISHDVYYMARQDVFTASSRAVFCIVDG